MSGAITIQVQDTGNLTLEELKSKLEEYVLLLTMKNEKTKNSDFFGSINFFEDPMEIQLNL